ncbi:MAG: hypothetical protein Q8Q09_01445 [Deltaproteobacteria bacterium]|nr:hypothetical protein [Deltaproteobacteria bacterium]
MVSMLETLRSAFSDSGFTSGAEFYVRADVAAAYLDACAEHSLVVLGVEAFDRHGDKLKPRVDLIADFSRILESSSDWNEAIEIGCATHASELRS